MLGEWDKSIDCMQKLLEISKKVSDVNLLSLAYWSLAWTYLSKGEFDVGIDYSKKCLDISPTPLFAVFGTGYLGLGYYKKGKLDKSIDYLEKAVQQANDFGLGHQHTEFSLYMAEAYLSTNKKEQALKIVNNTLEIIRHSGYRYWEGAYYRFLGEVCDKSEFKKAKKHIEDSIKILKKNRG